MTPSKGIYALLSSSFPYVGQYGCIHDQRPPFSRLREHYTHAPALQTVFRVPQRRARPPMWHKTPSFPKLLNRHGPGHVTMLRMRNVQENAQALLLEGRLETALTPTCNSVAPGGALLCDTWETIVNKLSLPPECKTLVLQAHTPAHTTDQSTNVHMLLQFLTRAARYVKGPLFEKLFKKVAQRVNMEWGVELPRRLTLKLPTYGKSIANWVTNTLQTLFSESCVPPALKVWLRCTNKCIWAHDRDAFHNKQ